MGGKTLTSTNPTDTYSIPTSTVPSNAVAIMSNVTVTNTTAWTFITVWPDNLTTETITSDVNWTGANQTVANADNITLPPIGSTNQGKINLTNAFGSTNLILDVYGYYA